MSSQLLLHSISKMWDEEYGDLRMIANTHSTPEHFKGILMLAVQHVLQNARRRNNYRSGFHDHSFISDFGKWTQRKV